VKYMLMIIGPENWAEGMTEAQLREKIGKHIAFGAELRASGCEAGGEKLQPASQATTLRRTPGGVVAVDGPYAETKDLFGGFYLIDVESLDEAIGWARKLPLVDGTFVEVRPCRTGAEGSVPVRGKHRWMVMFLTDRDRRMSVAEIFASIDRHYELSLELAVQGKFVSSRALGPPSDAATLQWREGRALRSDGPFAETRELLMGYFVIACDTKREALEWAEQLMAGADACEVRPIHEF